MSDPILEHPWQCHGKECKAPGGWHKSIYSLNDEYGAEEFPYLVSAYGDGDWEECEDDHMPTHDENISAWRDYFAWAAEHGSDPLEEFFLVHPWEQKTETWFLQFRKDGRRVVVSGALPDEAVMRDVLPDDVALWALANKQEDGCYVVDQDQFDLPLGLGLLRGFADDDPNVSHCYLDDNDTLLIGVEIDVRYPRDAEEVKNEIRTLAAKAAVKLED